MKEVLVSCYVSVTVFDRYQDFSWEQSKCNNCKYMPRTVNFQNSTMRGSSGRVCQHIYHRLLSSCCLHNVKIQISACQNQQTANVPKFVIRPQMLWQAKMSAVIPQSFIQNANSKCTKWHLATSSLQLLSLWHNFGQDICTGVPQILSGYCIEMHIK